MRDYKPRTLPRPYALPHGGTTTAEVRVCYCRPHERRGPAGGCCGACGGSIPNGAEKRLLGNL